MAISPSSRDRFEFRYAASTGLGRITQAGLLRHSTGPWEAPMRILGSYALVYSLEGVCHFRDANGLERDIVPGDGFVLFPEIGHRYGPGEAEDWSEFYLIFDGPLFDLWRRTGLLDPARPFLHCEPISEWLARLDSVLGAARRPGFSPPLVEISRFQQVLAEMLAGGPRGPGEQGDLRMIQQVCTFLETGLEEAFNGPALARRLGMSYESFRKKFTRITGKPPLQYRNARIIERACLLMRQGRMTDKRIAESLGFCNEFHFSRMFKRIVGVPPRVFRRRFPALR